MHITIFVPEILSIDLQYIIEIKFILCAIDVVSSIGFHLSRKDIIRSSYGFGRIVEILS